MTLPTKRLASKYGIKNVNSVKLTGFTSVSSSLHLYKTSLTVLTRPTGLLTRNVH